MRRGRAEGQARRGVAGRTPQALVTVWAYPFLPDATRHAMDALERSVHDCHVCHTGRPAPLAEEVAFLTARLGRVPALERLLALRRAYRPSYGFVLACLPALARLHLHTATRLRFPRPMANVAGRGLADAA